MGYTSLLYGVYLLLWFGFTFFNPWAQVKYFYLPLYVWISCILLPSLLCLVLAVKAYSSNHKKGEIVRRGMPLGEVHYFFLGGNTSSFALALSLVASYISGSTFLAGPSMAMRVGYSWVLLASIQVPSLFLLTGLLSKPFLALSRKFTFLSLLDFLKVRYPSRSLLFVFSLLFSLSLLLMVVIQLMAAGRIMQGVLKFDYSLSLFLFLVIISFYTVIGGFKHVVITDVIQAFFMLLFVFLLGATILLKTTGSDFSQLLQAKGSCFFSIHGGDPTLSTSYFLSMWVLLGVGLLGSPYMVNRLLSLHTSRQVYSISFWSTIFMAILIIGIHFFAVLGSAFDEGLPANDTSWILLMERLWGRGAKFLFAVAPLMAIMSSVDTLILIFASLLWSFLIKRTFNNDQPAKGIRSFKLIRNGIITAIVTLVFLLALYPPEFLVWLNLFALALTQVIFFAPVFFGIFYLRGNILSVWLSMGFGLLAFCLWQIIFKGSTLQAHPVLAGFLASIVGYFIGSLKKLTPEENRVQQLFKELMSINSSNKAQK